MKIIRPVNVTDSMVNENTSYPPAVNAWEPTGFAAIPSGQRAIGMAFSGSDDQIAVATEDSVIHVARTDSAQVVDARSFDFPFSTISASPAADDVAVSVDGQNLYVYRPMGTTREPLSTFNTNTVFGATGITSSKINWISGGIVWYIRSVSGYLGFRVALIDPSDGSKIWDNSYGIGSFIQPDLLWAGPGGVLLAVGDGGTLDYKMQINNPANGDLVNYVETQSRDFGGAVINSTGDTVYYTLQGTSGPGRGLYKATGAGFNTITAIEQPSGLPTEPGSLRISSDDALLSVSTGFSYHILDLSNDTWITATDRSTFKTNENTPPIEFNRDNSLVAVGPRQPDDLGVYNLWETTGWTQITADQSDYLIGDTVYEDKKLYEALVDNPGQSPKNGVNTDPPQWVFLGFINPWKMFDGGTSSPSLGASLDVSLTPGAPVTGVALLGMGATTVQVTMTDPTDGLVYDSGVVSLLDNGIVDNWFQYFFAPYQYVQDFTVVDLPFYSDATIDVSVVSGEGDAAIGELVIGSVLEIGEANFGTSVGIIDYSRKEVDQFGNFQITQRRFSKRAEYDVTLQSARTGSVQTELAKYRTTPIVWIGDENRPSTIVYGYYRDFDIILSNLAVSDCSITVEGL